jgi:hypothetical protein
MPDGKPKKRRVPLGQPLTAAELAAIVGTGETPAEVLEAQELWRKRAGETPAKWQRAGKAK